MSDLSHKFNPVRSFPAANTGFFISGICLFALCIHLSMPGRLIAFFGLIIAAIAFFHELNSIPHPALLLGICPFSKRTLYFILLAAGFGFILGLLFLWAYKIKEPIFHLRWFAMTAACIGLTEELLFRGYIQGCLQKNAVFAVCFASVAHTLYKGLLFIFPPITIKINFPIFILLTLVVGVLFGILRHVSKSVLPAITAHACFDIVAYGSLSNAPWWVWS